jgi:hypothetical protein
MKQLLEGTDVMRLFVLVTGLTAIVLISLAADANAQGTGGTTPIDWSLLQTRQQAYDALRGSDDYAARDSAYSDLVAAARLQGLSIPQFDGSPASNAAREELNGALGGLPSERVTTDWDPIPIEAVCSEGLCFTGAPAGRIRENAAASGLLIDTWAAEAMPEAVYIQAKVPRPYQAQTPLPPPPAPASPPPPSAPAPKPPSPAFDPKKYIGQGNRYNCKDFATQAQAQAVLRADPTDPNKLDKETDGIACETNPGPYDRVPVSH